MPEGADIRASHGEAMQMRDAFGQTFTCYLPDDPVGSADSASNTSSLQLADADVAALAGTCHEMRIGWWTYQLCHGKHMRHYHTVRPVVDCRLRVLDAMAWP